MTTTINRPGQVTQLSYKENKQSLIISFRNGYLKMYFDDQDIPDGLMLRDKVEVSILIKDEN